MANGDNDEDNRRDLTRIEDLSEFLHVEDSNVDDIFGGLENKSLDRTITDIGEVLNFSTGANLEEVPELPDLPTDDVAPLELNDSVEGILDGNLDENLELNLEGSLDETPESEFEYEPTAEFQITDDSVELQFGDAQDAPNTTDSPFQNSSYEDFSFTSTDSLTESLPDEELAADFTEVKEDPTSHSLNQFARPEKFEEVKNFAQNFS